MNFGRKKAGKKSAGRRRNGNIAENHGAGSAADEGVVLPRLEFDMALQIVGPGDENWGDENWTAIVRDAAEAAGGDLLFVLPYAEGPHAKEKRSSAERNPIDHAMVRLVENGKSRLVLVHAGAAGFHLVEEDAIDAGLVRFARASIDVLERLGADKRVVAPLTTHATH